MLWGMKRLKHLRRQRQANQADRQPQRQRQQQRCVDSPLDAWIGFGPKKLRNQNACSQTHPQKQADQQVDNRPAGAHGGQGLAAHIIAHHSGVHCVIELLKQVAQQQRQGEPDNLFPGRPLGHIHCPHLQTSFCFYHLHFARFTAGLLLLPRQVPPQTVPVYQQFIHNTRMGNPIISPTGVLAKIEPVPFIRRHCLDFFPQNCILKA